MPFELLINDKTIDIVTGKIRMTFKIVATYKKNLNNEKIL